jgi:dihydroxy-acid dehydratase
VSRKYEELRSTRWYSAETRWGHLHRQRTKQAGFSERDFTGKPVIGILNTWSELNPCHLHFRARADEVKRGVWQAGGFPVEVPVTSLGEVFVKPTAMLYRDFLAMEVEEVIRCHPIDGVVLMGGCDKTTPAMLMGAITMGLPAIFLPAGPMLNGRWRGELHGSGTDTMRYFLEMKAGRVSKESFSEMEDSGARSPGTCMAMGTASTMMAIAEALGFCLPGASSIPAVDSRHAHMASNCGRRIVDMVWDDVTPASFLTKGSFHNAITTLLAMGGSTNAIIHLLAVARRAGIELVIDDLNEISPKVPVLADIKPSGRFLMEEFFEAGGLRAVLGEIRDLLDLECKGVSGRTLGQILEDVQRVGDDAIRPRSNPLYKSGGLAVLRGSLAPDGAIIKSSAASPNLLKHRGRAVVFKNFKDYQARINDPNLDIDESCILVLQNAGPRGAPGMPESGMMPLPTRLLQQGVKDMIRISDARMSGTHYGTVVLHVAPESAAGGPLALVQDGDFITLDVAAHRVDLNVDEAELTKRRAAWVEPEPRISRGWGRLYHDQVTQANEGADLRFLRPGAPIPDPEIFG